MIFAFGCSCLSLLAFSGALTEERGLKVSGESSSGIHNNTAGQSHMDPADQFPSGLTATASAKSIELPDEARWEHGELLPPLPRDMQQRAEAIAKAQSNALAASAGADGVVYSGAAARSKVEPSFASLREISRRITPYIPPEVVKGDKSYNLKLPDTFELSKAELQRISRESPSSPDEAPAKPPAHALIQEFEGIDQTALTPPDCDIASGPEYIMVVVNASFAIYDKCGNQITETTFADFLGDATSFLFDPKVIYDVWDSRWVMSLAARRDADSECDIVVIISASDDPTGGWWWYYFDITLDGSTPTNFWGDYPDLGADPNAVYITTNQFTFPPIKLFQYAKIRILDKSEIYNATAAGWYDFTNMNNPGDGTKAFSLRAARMHAWPGNYWLVNSKSEGGSILSLWSVTGPFGTPALTGYNIPVAAAYDDPPPAEQPNGTYVDCGDARLLTASYRDGYLWTGMGQRKNTGEAVDRSEAHVYQIHTIAKSIYFTGGLWQAGYYYAYPAIDFDEDNNGIMVFSRGGPSQFMGTYYADVLLGGGISSSSLLAAGQTNYAGGGAGTFADPFRWGDYYGCDADPFDNLTLWFYGQFASNKPNPSWDTHIGATSFNGPGALSVTPTAWFTPTGLEGGPFTPSLVTYALENTGGAALTWGISEVDYWNTPGLLKGQIDAGATEFVDVALNSSINSFSPGTYTDNYRFTNCYNGSNTYRYTSLTVGIDGGCTGAVLDLIPNATPDDTTDENSQERGVYITAIKDFEVCALGMEQDLALPQTLTARIYSADGTTRGPLLASGTLQAVQAGKLIHYIPINYVLEACQEYEITVQFGATNSWDWWNENLLYEPFDIGGVIRVRDGSSGGLASNNALPYFSVIGTDLNCPGIADLGSQEPPLTVPDDNQTRGSYVTALHTYHVCSLGWKANLVVPQTLTARIYQANGTTRGNLLATGSIVATASGNVFHDIPISAALLAGHDYDFSVEFGIANSWDCWDDRVVAPYTVADVIEVRDGEYNGGASNWILPHFRMGWGSIGGAPFDLGKHWDDIDVYPPPLESTQDFYDYGIYITSWVDQELYALGWRADIVPGETVTMRVYQASGTNRGALIAEGSIVVATSGMRWHDVPISVSLEYGENYDLEVDIPDVNSWLRWSDAPGLPYQPYGVVEVLDGEQGGDAANYALIHMRMFACDPELTEVENLPMAKVPFYLAPPSPNPLSGSALFRYHLAEAGPVTMTIYDVAGRRITTLLNNELKPAGPGTYRFDSSRFASGVYFLRVESKNEMLSRKMIIVH
ncbi:MAG: T9SS type A sorting domain-containing protein [Candidatus Latescibacterota bacterium]